MFQCVFLQQVHAVGQQFGAEVKRVLVLAIMECPAVATWITRVQTQVMVVQVSRLARCSMALQVSGARAKDPPYRKQGLRDQVDRGGGKDLQCTVDTRFDR